MEQLEGDPAWCKRFERLLMDRDHPNPPTLQLHEALFSQLPKRRHNDPTHQALSYRSDREDLRSAVRPQQGETLQDGAF
ncbi:MAG: hypothetical protein K9L28_00735 [Synergistales bacterium]|nr:hypothetical protein [Synergistales bacterium]